MRYNMRRIMAEAWKIFRKGVQTFAEALRLSWANAKAHNAAKASAEVTEETHTWSGWQALGFEVIHESKALYKVLIHDPATKSGHRTTCYFGVSQVQPLGA